ncbi:MAG: hemin uptake protein HemP [Giesbergeria sp.]|nr:hemin uptake protein HemP [Giesbergeria sp.]
MSASLTASSLPFCHPHNDGYFNGSHSASGSNEPQPSSGAQAVDSFDLLQGHKSVTIAHNGAVYRLQATRLGKLILTK